MKKISMIVSGIIMFIILISPVKAETIQYNSLYNKTYYENFIQIGQLEEIMTEYNEYKEEYPFYIISLDWDFDNMFKLYGFKNATQIYSINESIYIGGNIIQIYNDNGTLKNEEIEQTYIFNNIDNQNKLVIDYFDSNISVLTNWNDYQYEEIEIRGFYEGDSIIIENNQVYPKLKDLIQYDSWSGYENEHLEGYMEVNLDNYKYILLSLKNYNQTQAFQTNLQVKGQIGITPIYNFGQTSKDSVTGVQVQDRCNLEYENYTSYPFYILQGDLQNNAIYAVKECSIGSSFKFDSTIFNITYITAENEENPTITIGGKTYNVIPYEDLPSTATKNEEDNYIPGESGSATDTGGLDSAIKSVQQKMSEIWGTFTYFTDFVGQLFSSLPEEIRTILLSAFTVGIILGLIKIFLGK